MANARNHLKSIIDHARNLLSHSEAGGDREHAFNLMVNETELKKAESDLNDMCDKIDDELAKVKEEVLPDEVAEPIVEAKDKKLDLIKSAAKRGEPSSAGEVVAALKKQLVGKTVPAFGKPHGLWGGSDKPINFKIANVTSSYNDEDFVSVDVHLAKYKEKDNGLIYTDPTFIKALRALVKSIPAGKYVKSFDYSEQGMQGKDYVNLDVTVKLPK